MLAMKVLKVAAYALIASQAAYSAQEPSSSPLPELCAVLADALSAYPTYQNAPTHAVETNQSCAVSEDTKTWSCELLFRENCTNVSRGSADEPGKVFGAALLAAERCFPDRVRRNTQINENTVGQRRRVLREAHFGYLDGTMPTLIISADTSKQLGDARQCETTRIDLRFVEMPLPPKP